MQADLQTFVCVQHEHERSVSVLCCSQIACDGRLRLLDTAVAAG